MRSRLPVKYGDRFDRQIARDLRAGKTAKSIALAIGVSAPFVLYRAHGMGLSQEIYENGARARSLAKMGRKNPRSVSYSRAGRAVVEKHGLGVGADTEVSRLAHRIRVARVPLSRHAIAALHERGLTLEELHHATGRPVADLVGFIREAVQ